ncbi:N-formylglutamate amidohydrolase [Rheinheimera salexigens]|uniref:N-formylglutamate amidohydrolase n=1 Tax=Rheinheimera salexigens TaxID=1628148 RepID=A0A1E7Q3A1_9GAMM|nr:N-formylglutamate amidohydrolase [Rheinheimera salexigens]OEY68694.1 N-formylglutamate amidohydrolase [Rheinheimera salexigens]
MKTENSESYVLHLPQQHVQPLVFDSPHSGMVLPADFAPLASVSQMKTGWDAFVDELWQPSTEQGAAVLAATVSRMYIDLNRAPDDIPHIMLEGAWPTALNPTAYSERGMGLLRQWALPGQAMYAKPLAVKDVQQRLARYYQPYHQRLKQLLDQRHQEFGAVWHVDCHSMKSKGNAMNIDAGTARADFVIGNRDGESASAGFTNVIVESLQAMGYQVSLNQPYKGGYLTQCYANPTQRRHSIQIEINRHLYMDESGFSKHLGFVELQRNLQLLTTNMLAYIEADLCSVF